MAHKEQKEFINNISLKLNQYFNNCDVLEIGSLDINGSIRDFFKNCNYIGNDVAEGNGVDIVSQGQDLKFPDNTFDVVISCEVMEHNPFWKETFKNMIRMCKPDGLIVFTCATKGRIEHGTSQTSPESSPLTLEWNYYKNLSHRDFEKAFKFDELFSYYKFWYNWKSYDLYFLGTKAPTYKDKPLIEETIKYLNIYYSKENNRKICKYRKFVANYIGEWWFKKMRDIITILNYLHNSH